MRHTLYTVCDMMLRLRQNADETITGSTTQPQHLWQVLLLFKGCHRSAACQAPCPRKPTRKFSTGPIYIVCDPSDTHGVVVCLVCIGKLHDF